MAVKRTPITDEEREEIIAAMRSGMGRNEIARQFNRSNYRINQVAREIDHTFDASHASTRARQINTRYGRERRLALVEQGLEAAQRMIQEITKANDLKNWSISVGVLIDKARLEETESGVHGGLIRQFLNEHGAEAQPETGSDDSTI